MVARIDSHDSQTHKNRRRQERFLTVSVYPEAAPHVPWLRLHGLWLHEAGFTPNSRVRVRVMFGCLVITKEQA